MAVIENKCHWLPEIAKHNQNGYALYTEQRVYTCKEYLKEVNYAASFLSSEGIEKNSRIGILYRHNYNFPIIINALWLLGAVPVPLNTRLTDTELLAQVHLAGIDHLVVDEYFSNALAGYDNPVKTIFSDHRKNELPVSERAPFNPDSIALIMFTSGSSGTPKAVVHTFASLYSSVNLFGFFAAPNKDDVFLSSLPLYHIGGFMVFIRALLCGCGAAFPESLQFEDIADALENFNPSVISIVPTTLERLLTSGTKPNPKLKYLFTGGGPAPSELILKAYNSGWPVVKVYGSTETSSMVAALKPDELKDRPESAGFPLAGVELKSINGILCIKSPSLFSGYLNNKAETDLKLTQGWYNTGDFASLDKEGFLYIESRREDIIITGGENVSAAEVEWVLKKYAPVEDAYVFSLNDDKWGQVVCAALQPAEGETIDEEEIKDYLRGILSSFKIPKKFFFPGKLPRNEMGKINRQALLNLISKT